MVTQKKNAPCQLPHKQGASTEKGNQTALDDSTTPGQLQAELLRDAMNARAAAEQRFKDCPGLKRYLLKRFHEEVNAKRRFSMQQLFEEARKKDWTRTSGDPFRLNNNYRPAMTRILLEEVPDARPFIKTRKSGCDWAFNGEALR